MSELYEHPETIVNGIKKDRIYRFANGNWYRWTGSYYALVEFMEGEVDALIEAQFKHVWQMKAALAAEAIAQGLPPPPRKVVSEATIRAVIRKLRTECACDGLQPAGKINFRNGTLDVEANKLEPHAPADFFVGAPTVDFDPSAIAPQWVSFLEEILPEENARKLLQRWFGLCLTTDTSRQKCLMLCGASRGGKGVISRILTDVVGQDRTCSVKLQSLAGDHGLQPLLGKVLALVDESTLDFKSDKSSIVSTLLTIVGEAPVTINPKHKDALPCVKLDTRFMFVANQLVNFGDSAGAMANRMMYLNFTKSFAGREDLSLYARLRAELGGIVAWSLRGLVDLRAEGFPEVESSQPLVQESRELNNHVLRFAQDCLEFDEQATCSKIDLFDAYQRWCAENGHARTCYENQFAKLLLAAHPEGLRSVRVQSNGRRVYQWIGVRVLPD